MNDENIWQQLVKKYPDVFLKDPTLGLDTKKEYPGAKPITNFIPEDEKQEWLQHIEYLEKRTKKETK